VGKDVFIAHCPERINPGDPKWNVANIAGWSIVRWKGLAMAVDFYKDITNRRGAADEIHPAPPKRWRLWKILSGISISLSSMNWPGLFDNLISMWKMWSKAPRPSRLLLCAFSFLRCRRALHSGRSVLSHRTGQRKRFRSQIFAHRPRDQ